MQQVLFHLPKLTNASVYIKSTQKFSKSTLKKDKATINLQCLKNDIVLLAKSLFKESIATKQPICLDSLFITPQINVSNVVNFKRTNWISAGSFELNKQQDPIISEYRSQQIPASNYFGSVLLNI